MNNKPTKKVDEHNMNWLFGNFYRIPKIAPNTNVRSLLTFIENNTKKIKMICCGNLEVPDTGFWGFLRQQVAPTSELALNEMELEIIGGKILIRLYFWCKT